MRQSVASGRAAGRVYPGAPGLLRRTRLVSSTNEQAEARTGISRHSDALLRAGVAVLGHIPSHFSGWGSTLNRSSGQPLYDRSFTTPRRGGVAAHVPFHRRSGRVQRSCRCPSSVTRSRRQQTGGMIPGTVHFSRRTDTRGPIWLVNRSHIRARPSNVVMLIRVGAVGRLSIAYDSRN
jgi:hypothetical protein